jgi:hypothetical protein
MPNPALYTYSFLDFQRSFDEALATSRDTGSVGSVGDRGGGGGSGGGEGLARMSLDELKAMAASLGLGSGDVSGHKGHKKTWVAAIQGSLSAGGDGDSAPVGGRGVGGASVAGGAYDISGPELSVLLDSCPPMPPIGTPCGRWSSLVARIAEEADDLVSTVTFHLKLYKPSPPSMTSHHTTTTITAITAGVSGTLRTQTS